MAQKARSPAGRGKRKSGVPGKGKGKAPAKQAAPAKKAAASAKRGAKAAAPKMAPKTAGKRKTVPAPSQSRQKAPPKKAAPLRAKQPARQRDYAAEYRRRIERERARAAAEGRAFSRQRARGHMTPAGQTEWQRRKARERAFIESFAAQQMARTRGADYAEILSITQEFVREHGIRALRLVEAVRDELHLRYLENGSQPIGIDLANVLVAYDVPDILLFYHAS